MAIVCTGMACSSFVRWLVILIGGSSSEVGARSAPGAEAGSRYAQGHRRFGAIVEGVSECKESARRAQGERRPNAAQRATSQCDLGATQQAGQ